MLHRHPEPAGSLQHPDGAADGYLLKADVVHLQDLVSHHQSIPLCREKANAIKQGCQQATTLGPEN